MNFEKLIRPSTDVVSRIHDRTGASANARSIITNLPRSIHSRLLLDIFNLQPNRPWLSYNAVKVLERKLRSKPCRVLEFGSGASTPWFADRAAELHSVESDADWYTTVISRLNLVNRPRQSVQYELQTQKENYVTFRSSAELMFDIILVDGPWRRECVSNHTKLLAPSGLLYLDNSDADTSTVEAGELLMTRELLYNFAKKNGYRLDVFTDFAPCVLHATQGIMVTATAR